ncbi:MAG: uroporphyrinogen-III synthase, partial [Comamonas sp.]
MRHVVVTRPQPEAQQWVQRLTAQGCGACAVPLMEIGPCTHPAAQAAVQQALAQLASFQAVMFVSGNAVRYFFDRLHDQGLHLPATTRLWAPGPGTAQALLDAQQPL